MYESRNKLAKQMWMEAKSAYEANKAKESVSRFPWLFLRQELTVQQAQISPVTIVPDIPKIAPPSSTAVETTPSEEDDDEDDDESSEADSSADEVAAPPRKKAKNSADPPSMEHVQKEKKSKKSKA